VNDENEDTLISSRPKLFGSSNAGGFDTQNPKASVAAFSSQEL